MEKDPKGTDPCAADDPRPVYEPPQVMRLGEVHNGAGATPCRSGSSATAGCDSGSFAGSSSCTAGGNFS